MLEAKASDVAANHPGQKRVQRIRQLLESSNAALLCHRYFQMCRANQLDRERVLGVLKEVYCFSVFFERLLTRRVSDYPNGRDPRVLKIARDHLRNELGHVELFRQCLLANGVSSGELANVAPKMFTKAMFGYLTTTILHENEYVTNVAMMQVMESIGFHFFKETLGVMQLQSMSADAFARHVEEDERHLEEGMDLIAQFDDETTDTAVAVIQDLYRLMGFMLDEWLGFQPVSGAPRRRKSNRPPRAN